MQRVGVYILRSFLVSRNEICISEFKDIVLNVQVDKLPEDEVYLMGFDSLPFSTKIKYKITKNGNTTTFQKTK